MNLVFDCDSTLITCESLEELARISLEDRPDKEDVLAKMGEITNLGMEGKLAFNQSLSRRLELFGPTRSHINELEEFLFDHITPSVLAHKRWLELHQDQVYVVTGGFMDYLVPVLKSIGLRDDHILANEFTYDGEYVSGFNEGFVLSQPGGKVKQVAELDLPGPLIMIGDGSTDVEVRDSGEADEFWAYAENVNRPSVFEAADKIVKDFDELITFAESLMRSSQESTAPRSVKISN